MITKTLNLFGRSIRECGIALERVGYRLEGNYAFKAKLSRHSNVQPLHEMIPRLGDKTFIAPSASVIGSAEIGSNTSVWFGAILRSDVNKITVGDNVSIGDGSTVHATRDGLHQKGYPTNVGNNVLIGPNSHIHGCTLEDGSSIGPKTIILDGAVVGSESQVGPNSLVLSGTYIPPKQLWEGRPAKFVRNLTDADIQAAKALLSKSLSQKDVHINWQERDQTPKCS
eukprot:TRINITY_DN8663_c0_g1_i1.p1 TRINITY_DN8663_c0_g1~~TRINITY_DN8663_c0_g1_i1.p1  ORF type:complete len:226 (+),score=38.70 TRINITY_DN8663_c0_g1_i1:42-719(+)